MKTQALASRHLQPHDGKATDERDFLSDHRAAYARIEIQHETDIKKNHRKKLRVDWQLFQPQLSHEQIEDAKGLPDLEEKIRDVAIHCNKASADIIETP